MAAHEPAPGSDTDVELLRTSPAMAPLIARAAVTAVGRPGVRGELPGRRVMLTGVQQDVERLAAYARVCGFTLRDRVPPTWLHVLTFPLQVHLMAGRDFPFAMAGMVHVANEMSLLRPVRVGERLTLSTVAAGMRPHRSGVTVELVGQARVGDEPVWHGSSSYLVKGQRLPVPRDEAEAEPEPADDLDAPLVTPSARWRLHGGLGRDYAAVSGDVNPIHLNPLAAKAFGFPRTIAHGMWTHARALAALESRLPEAYEVAVRFRKPVLLPTTVTFGTTQEGGEHRFLVASTDGSREHLIGRVRPLG